MAEIGEPLRVIEIEPVSIPPEEPAPLDVPEKEKVG